MLLPNPSIIVKSYSINRNKCLIILLSYIHELTELIINGGIEIRLIDFIILYLMF